MTEDIGIYPAPGPACRPTPRRQGGGNLCRGTAITDGRGWLLAGGGKSCFLTVITYKLPTPHSKFGMESNPENTY